jgi:predicted permease
MFDVLLQMVGLILCGVAWRLLRPAGLEPGVTRKVLTSLVYYLLLPALVISVLWKAELGTGSLIIAGAAAFGIVIGLLLSTLTCRFCSNQPAEAGAIILAVTFPNATYMGLPVLEAIFGAWGRSIAIQYDLFACTPLLFTLGMMLAMRFGSGTAVDGKLLQGLLRIPPLWAALVGIALNLLAIPQPESLGGLLTLLQRGVVPLMLFSLGLSLEWSRSRWRLLPSLIPVIGFRLLLIPALVLLLLNALHVGGDLRTAIVMEAAMPSMVIGIVICDRFNLDTSLYAAAVTVTTALSLITLPLWHSWAGS